MGWGFQGWGGVPGAAWGHPVLIPQPAALWGGTGPVLGWITSQSWDSLSEHVLSLFLFSPGLSWRCLSQSV